MRRLCLVDFIVKYIPFILTSQGVEAVMRISFIYGNQGAEAVPG